MKINLAHKYRLYPTEAQEKVLDHHMFVSNQAYNVCVHEWKKASKKKEFLRAVEYDSLVKIALKQRGISFKTVILQQARMHFQRALSHAFSKRVVSVRKRLIALAQQGKDRVKAFLYGFPRFKSSKNCNQSFTWNNQGCSFKDHTNSRFKIFRFMKQDFVFRYHREFPKDFKLCSITVSKDAIGYHISFTIEVEKEVNLVKAESLSREKCVGIDLNTKNVALSVYEKPFYNGVLAKNTKNLEKKQSRRVLNKKVGKNYKKAQRKINKKVKKRTNYKEDIQNKIISRINKEFDMVAVEDLGLQGKMTKSARGTIDNPGKHVKQKAGLNRVILEASFYHFRDKLGKKIKNNGKLFVAVCPKNTSIECNVCGHTDKKNRKIQSKFKCLRCNHSAHADINAAKNILDRGLASLGIGTIRKTIKKSLSSSGALAYG